jgi:hypothetical protein
MARPQPIAVLHCYVGFRSVPNSTLKQAPLSFSIGLDVHEVVITMQNLPSNYTNQH